MATSLSPLEILAIYLLGTLCGALVAALLVPVC